MNAAWSVAEAALTVGGRVEGAIGKMPSAIWADSRMVRPGDGFVALRGAQRDGHEFLADAVVRGAELLIIADGKRESLPQSDRLGGVACLLVRDPDEALPLLATAYKARIAPRECIAVTGSVGKTTTRETIAQTLGQAFLVHAAGLSYNTRVGCALSTLGMPEGTEMLVLEMGANHPGEIEELTLSYAPTIAVLTEIASAHLEGFGSLEGVLRAKWEIVRSPNLHAVSYNVDNDLLQNAAAALPSHIRLIPVGRRASNAGIAIHESEIVLVDGQPRLSAEYVAFGRKLRVVSSLFGTQHAYTLGFALGVGMALGMDADLCVAALERTKSIEGRGTIISRGRGFLVDETYNANPASMKAALKSAVALPVPGKRVAVLGGMRELGKDSAVLHAEVLRFALETYNAVILVGDEWEESKDARILRACDGEGAVTLLRRILGGDDVILVKGSHAYALDKVVRGLME